MKKILAATAAGFLAIVTATVLPAQQIASQDASSVQAGSYKVDGYHTQVVFTLSHFGFSDFYGLFSGASGTLQLDPARPQASRIDVSFPIQSVSTTVAALDSELKGDKWFDAARFPNATFTSTAIKPTGKGSATITGNFTLHGVTKPITLTASFVGAGVNPLTKAYTVGFRATGTIKRSDFGVSTYVPMIGDEVQLSLTGAFEKQA
jgi:polyisoprenoid-binding protein YceI